MPQFTMDCQGLPCPQPVLRCKACIEESAPRELEVIVDNLAAKENVSRFLGTCGYTVSVEENDGVFRLTAQHESGASVECAECEVMTEEQLRAAGRKISVFITSDVIGRGDDKLGTKLMANFLATLPELGSELWRVIMVNAGVKLAVDDSPVLEKLKVIEGGGASILVCGTCLEYFGILEKKAVGGTTNMLDVVTSLQLADKVIQV